MVQNFEFSGLMEVESKKEPFFPSLWGYWGILTIYFKKYFINKKCAYGLTMKPHRVLDKYFEVFGQADQIIPESGEKSLHFQKKPSLLLTIIGRFPRGVRSKVGLHSNCRRRS